MEILSHTFSQNGNKFTLYGTTTCPYCAAARAYLHKAKIPFKDINIDESASDAKAFKQLNQAGVPVLVAADRLVVGFENSVYDDMIRLSNK